MVTAKKQQQSKKAPAGTQYVQVPVYLDVLREIDTDRRKISAEDLNHCSRAKIINRIFRQHYADRLPAAPAPNGTALSASSRRKKPADHSAA